MEDLVSGKVRPGWGIEDGGLIKEMGQTAAPGSTFAKLHAGAIYLRGACSEWMDDLKPGKYSGAVCEKVTAEKYISDDFSRTGECNFYVAKNTFLPLNFAMGFQVGPSRCQHCQHQHEFAHQTNSPYLEQANQWLLSLLRGGFHQSFFASAMPNATRCRGAEAISKSRKKREMVLSLQQVCWTQFS